LAGRGDALGVDDAAVKAAALYPFRGYERTVLGARW
jgi:hypothetical protein